MKTGSNKRISLKLYGKRPERAGEYDLLPGRHAQASYRRPELPAIEPLAFARDAIHFDPGDGMVSTSRRAEGTAVARIVHDRQFRQQLRIEVECLRPILRTAPPARSGYLIVNSVPCVFTIALNVAVSPSAFASSATLSLNPSKPVSGR